MNGNFITNYLQYKVNYLSQYGLFFYDGLDKEFIHKYISEYVCTYVNNYYYNFFETLEDVKKINDDILKKELLGKRVELLDIYNEESSKYDEDTNKKNIKIIEYMHNVVFFLSKLDRLRFNNKEEIDEKIEKLFDKYPKMREMIGKKMFKLKVKVKRIFENEDKIFMQSQNFKLDYSKFVDDYFIYINVYQDVQLLKTNYKRSLVKRVFDSDIFTIDKVKSVIWDLSINIIKNIIDNNKMDRYMIYLDDSLFYRGKFLLEEEFDNDLLREHIDFLVDLNTYKSNTNIFNYLGFEVSCLVDLSHINNVVDKLKDIDELGTFNYILIDEFKSKDEDEIRNFKCRDECKIIFVKE